MLLRAHQPTPETPPTPPRWEHAMRLRAAIARADRAATRLSVEGTKAAAATLDALAEAIELTLAAHRAPELAEAPV